MANPPLEYDWADVEDEIDFGAPVFSDDEDLPPELTTGVATLNTNDEPASSHCNTGRTSFTGDRVHDQSRSHEPTAGSRRIPPPDLDGWGLRNDRRRNDTPRSDRPQPSTQAGMNERRARNAPERRPPHDQDREAWRRGDRDTLHDRLHVPSGADRPRRQVIPLPPKPAPELDANLRVDRIDRSRSPSYRSRSPLAVPDQPRRVSHRSPSPPPPARSSKAHMDHVQIRESGSRRPRDTSPGGRWGKTPHEDKPYPSKPPPEIAGSPKDDTIYFRRRPTEPGKDTPTANSSSGSGTRHERHDALDSPRPPRDETSPRRQRRDASAPGEGTMHHERLETDGGKEHSMRDASASSGRWEKVKDPKPDLPYPENSLDTSSSRTPKVRGQVDSTGAGANPSEISSNKTPKARGQVNSTGAETNSSASRSNRGKGHEPSRNRGKGGRQALEADHDDNNDDTSAGSSVPWWEQATYSAKSKKEEPEPKAKPTTNASKNVSTTAKKGTTSPAQNEAKTGDDVPWWEQSTYKLAPRQQTTTATSSSDTLSKNIASKASTGASSTSTTTTRKDTRTESDKMARREALGKKAPTNSGIESMVLLSRGGDDSGSSKSVKSHSIQEQVLQEIEQMIVRYEEKYGKDKLRPVHSKSKQKEELNVIVESFRKLREGLVAGGRADAFTAKVYELSVLYSLYAADTPELTKSLLRLVDIHNTLYPVNLKSSTLAFESIPKPRQRSLALSILFWIARPRAREGPDSKGPTDFLPGSPEALRANPLAGPVLYIYESQQLSKQDSSAQSMENDLGFALALWKTFRNGDWTRRERLVQGLSLSSSDSQNNRSYSPELRLMFRNHVSRSMSSARAISVEVMSKAYHSLPIKDVVQSVGLSDREETGPPFEVNLDENAAWLMDLRTKYQLEESVALVNGQLVFKVPKQKNAVSI